VLFSVHLVDSIDFRPFCVKPERGVVPPRDSFCMDISFYSECQGEFDGHLLIKYENGKSLSFNCTNKTKSYLLSRKNTDLFLMDIFEQCR
jgi:hypothetical protein